MIEWWKDWRSRWYVRRHQEAMDRAVEALQCGGLHPGYELMRFTGLSSGRLYRALAQLCSMGIVTRHKEGQRAFYCLAGAWTDHD
jgi:hypothetical protein